MHNSTFVPISFITFHKSHFLYLLIACILNLAMKNDGRARVHFWNICQTSSDLMSKFVIHLPEQQESFENSNDKLWNRKTISTPEQNINVKKSLHSFLPDFIIYFILLHITYMNTELFRCFIILLYPFAGQLVISLNIYHQPKKGKKKHLSNKKNR